MSTAQAEPSHAIDVNGISKAFGSTQVLSDVTLEASAGEVIALLGPSGCGKTTLLRLIAGLERPDAGQISLGGRQVVSERAFVPPDKRGIGLVFQDYALFPQRTVASNIAFGLRKLDAAARRHRVSEVLEQVDLPGLETRYPHELSGGQQQRVALARALAPKPSVLLLDEPFSNLDAALRRRLRLEMGRLLKALAVTTVFVTHDQDEALSLATRVAVMSRGQIAQIGTAEDVYARPATVAVAQAVGEANIVQGQLAGGSVTTPFGRLPGSGDTADGTVQVLIRPEQLEVTLAAQEVHGASETDSSERGVRATVHASEYLGRERHLLVRIQGCEQLLAVVCDPHGFSGKIAPGNTIFVRFGARQTCCWFREPDSRPTT